MVLLRGRTWAFPWNETTGFGNGGRYCGFWCKLEKGDHCVKVLLCFGLGLYSYQYLGILLCFFQPIYPSNSWIGPCPFHFPLCPLVLWLQSPHPARLLQASKELQLKCGWRDRTAGLQMRGAWGLLGCWAALPAHLSLAKGNSSSPHWDWRRNRLGEAQEEVSPVTSPHKQWRSLAELRGKRSLVLVLWAVFLCGLWLQRCRSFSE